MSPGGVQLLCHLQTFPLHRPSDATICRQVYPEGQRGLAAAEHQAFVATLAAAVRQEP